MCKMHFMRTEPFSFHDILNLWESHSALAHDMGVPKERARSWRTRGQLRPKYWPRLLERLEQRFGKKLTADDLMLAAAMGDEAKPSEQAKAA